MAKVNVYRKQFVPSTNTGMAPRSTNAAITNQELIWQEFQRLGKFLSGAGEELIDAKNADDIVKAHGELERVLNEDTEAQSEMNPVDRMQAPTTTPTRETDREVSLGASLSRYGNYA